MAFSLDGSYSSSKSKNHTWIDPRTSGVEPSGQRHGVPGLYVADGSIFPTAPGVNPQETIMALATIIARRIIDRHPLKL